MRRRAFPPFIALCAAGVFVSIELIGKHIATKFQAAGDTGICDAASFFSCADAARSPLSELFGVPIAALGGAFYLTLLVVAAMGRFSRREDQLGVPDVLVWAGMASVLYSAFLGVAGYVAHGTLCPYCVGLYGINLGLLITALLGHSDRIGEIVRRAPQLAASGGFWLTVAIMLMASGGAWAFYSVQARHAADQPRESECPPLNKRPAKVKTGEWPALGRPDASIVVVEFSDFECPYCKRLAEAIHDAVKGFDNVRVHFRNFPMDSACNPAIDGKFHEYACLAAKAATCAHDQGRFWEMHDRMFAHNKELRREDLLGYAGDLGLDLEKFLACFESPDTVTRIRKDIDAGRVLKVRGTPTFFVNGYRFIGARTPAELERLFQCEVFQAAGEAR